MNNSLLCLCLVLPLSAVAAEPATKAVAPAVIDDIGLIKKTIDGLGKLADAKKGGPTGKKLQELVAKAPATKKLELPQDLPERAAYDDLISSVAILAPIYKCNKCEHWHLGGSATAWCLTADGVFVTNYHCFEKADGAMMGICLPDGKVAAVKEILASDKAADLCLFRVEGEGFRPLAVGDAAVVGSKVRVISHPEGRFFYQSSGEVARYFRRPGRVDRKTSTWMSVTADFAKGSSGGPVVDAGGRVVGMVSNTQSIYYGASGKEPKGPLQMVIKNCVPVEAVRRMAGVGE